MKKGTSGKSTPNARRHDYVWRGLPQFRTLVHDGGWPAASKLLDEQNHGGVLFSSDELISIIQTYSNMPLDLFRKVVSRSDPELNSVRHVFRAILFDTVNSVDAVDADRFQILVEWQPHAMAATESIGGGPTTLLRELCQHGPTPHSLRLLEICLRANPNAAFRRGGCFGTPLTRLRVSHETLSDIRTFFLGLLDAYLSLRSKRGGTILHEFHKVLLLGSNAPNAPVVEAEEVLLEITREAARLQPDLLLAVDDDETDVHCGTILHHCARKHSYNLTPNYALRLLESYPQLASVENGRNVWPLHLAAGVNYIRVMPVPRCPYISRLVDLYPKALLERATLTGWGLSTMNRTRMKQTTPLQMWVLAYWDQISNLYAEEIEVGDPVAVDEQKQAFWDVVGLMAVQVGRMSIMPSGNDSISDAACQLHAILGYEDICCELFVALAIWNLRLFDWCTTDAAGTLPIFKILTWTGNRTSRSMSCLCQALTEMSANNQFAVSTIRPNSNGQFALHVGLRNCKVWQRKEKTDDYTYRWPARYRSITDPVAVIVDAMTLGGGSVLTRQSPHDGLHPFEIAAAEGKLDFCYDVLRRLPDVILVNRPRAGASRGHERRPDHGARKRRKRSSVLQVVWERFWQDRN